VRQDERRALLLQAWYRQLDGTLLHGVLVPGVWRQRQLLIGLAIAPDGA
jgi:hypothetical protein